MHAGQVVFVAGGRDRFDERRTVGVSSTAFKVSTQDGSGGLFIMEHTHRRKGGPPRHLHHNEDEWFYVVEGEYVVEVGAERFRLRPGDSVLAPREVPHVWAFVGDGEGKLLLVFAPASEKIEALFSNRPTAGGYSNEEIFRAHGQELVGPPLSVE